MDKTCDNRLNRCMLLAVIAIGVVLRITLRTSSSFWEDEIIAATHASQSFIGVITDAIFNDMHPPLFFLELHVWSYFGQSDAWLIANSVILGLAALASIFYVTRRLHDTQHALAVTAVFAALPVAIWMSGEVRMYTMLSVLFVWLYYFTLKAFAAPASATGPRLAIVALSAIVIYTHSIGFVAVFFYGVYAASLLAARKASRRDWLIWLAVFGSTGVIACPMVFADTFRVADMQPIHGVGDILSWMAGSVTGNGFAFIPWLRIAGLMTYIAVAIAGTIYPRTRRITLCFLIAPILLCLFADVVARPLFKTNYFSNFFSPFLALVIGELVLSLPLRKTARTVLLICVIAGLLTMAVANRHEMNAENTYFRQAAEAIVSEKQPGDVVWVPQPSMFWGIARYLAGPNWGSPLAISAPLRPQSRMWKIYDRLGPDLVKKLGLLPTSQSITAKDGMPILTALSSEPRAEEAKRLWVVAWPRGDLPPGFPQDNLGSMKKTRSLHFPPLELDLYEQSGKQQ